MKVNLLKLWYSFVIAFFICSERIHYFKTVDQMHIKHYLVMLTIFLSLFALNGRKIKRAYGFIPIFVSTLILYVISLLYQFSQSSFKLYALAEVYYFIIPIVFVLIVYNTTNKNYIDDYINLMFVVSLIALVITLVHSKNFNLENFIALFSLRKLFIDSASSIEETDLSVYFTIFYIYYSYKNDKIKKLVAFVACFLSYKRIAVLFAAFGLVYFRIIRKHRKPKQTVYYIAIIAFILAPFAVYFICNDDFAYWFYLKTGLDFNQFTMTRFEIINYIIDAKLTNYGLGTITNYLGTLKRSGQLNMHNDILKIYMETTFIGTVVFTYCFFRVSRDNVYKFMIMLFVFLELFGAHFLGSGSITFWILIYFAFLQIDIKEDEYREQLNKKAEQAKEKLKQATQTA